jgi:uncharacterized damage-inducible protein DinB
METFTLNCSHAVLLASYNEWMNAKLYEAAARLPPEEFAADKGAFFGSLLGTLNHLVVADILWLKRFALHPSNHAALESLRRTPPPQSLDQRLFADLPALQEYRRRLDETIRQWAASLAESDLHHVLAYSNTKGVSFRRRFSDLVLHFFNHQTHHRGQATTLLFQAGVDVGVTDLLALIPDERLP